MRLLPVILLLMTISGCEKGVKTPGPMDMTVEERDQWEINLVEMRIEKNEEFQDSTRTPLPLEELPSFVGLNYYLPEPALRFKVVLQTTANPDTVMLAKRKGRKVPYLRRGHVSFLAESRARTLTVFGPADASEQDQLWLPFYDTTNGQETYGGGRYLELELAEDGTVIVDFNFAFNPLCDYNPTKYDCTLPPQDNRLDFPVRAGEKTYRFEE
jgi:uncharacterized protein (DUF1684 family)